jgi:hypothetical protein
MATISEKYIGDHEVHTSSRGARYIITDDGRKLYVSSTNKTYRRSFKPRPGAYARFLANQSFHYVTSINDLKADHKYE